MKEENRNENHILNNNSANSTTKSNNYKKAGEIQNKLGSQTLQNLGVKNKKLADIASKNNGGLFSPDNNLANRTLKKTGQGMIANQLNRKDSLSNGSYNPFDKIKKNHFNGIRNNTNNSESNTKKENEGKKNTENVAKKGGSMTLQSLGVPKPLADTLSNKFAGPILEKRKKMFKIKITLILVSILMPLIIIISIIVGDGDESNANAADTVDNNLSGYVNNVCKGVTVTGENAGVYPLEEYVAGVVAHENTWSYNGNIENSKAQAVAARTYMLHVTNNCTNSIKNSTSVQTMSRMEKVSDVAKSSAEETAGQVLVDESDNYILTQYDALCLDSSDENNYYIRQKKLAIPKTWAKDNKIPSTYLRGVCVNGHGKGMSQWGARYLSTMGYTYDKILSYFYDNAKLKTLTSSSTSSGLEATSNGFIKRTSRALRDNSFFYNDNASNEGECAWYAVRRTNEILASIGSDVRVKSGGNGGDFCNSSDYSQFSKVYDISQIKPGMVISWKNSSYGHVAVIEDVIYNSDGSIQAFDISEGALNYGIGIGKVYPNSNTVVTRDYIWSLADSQYKKDVRRFACEGNLTESVDASGGCQKFVRVNYSDIRTRGWNGYQFVCAINLLG